MQVACKKQNINMNKKLSSTFFERDSLEVAPDLLGKYLVRRFDNGEIRRYRITDVEAYGGEEDKACHASKGRTKRTEVMYKIGGHIYVYLIYGMYWLLNIVTGKENQPQGVMIRSVEDIQGPGKVGKALHLDNSFYGESIEGNRLWIEDTGDKPSYKTAKRVGIDYAGEWKDKEWRFIIS